jgi:hypothetical protein
MKKIVIIWCLIILSPVLGFSQASKAKIDQVINEREAQSHLRFLASDELMGRDPIRPEIEVAARYISEQFWKYGAKQVPGAKEYYQEIPFRISGPAKSGAIAFNNQNFKLTDDFLVLDGPDINGTFPIAVAGQGSLDEIRSMDLKGKILVTRVGEPGRTDRAELFNVGRERMALALEKGAVAMIEMYNVTTMPWNLMVNSLNRTQFGIDQTGGGKSLPYVWMKDLDGALISALGSGNVKELSMSVAGKVNRPVIGHNVVAWIEGTDPQLKDEFVMLSAHYDHVGVGRPDETGDSIYNGARDNAVGTVAIINAAKYFAENPPKRSILLCAWTAEEKGLLGSAYFANNPLIPLNKIIFNLNIDNGGYNDTSIITVIGLGRTSGDDLIGNAVSDFGLTAIADPSPEQGLYDRSDNVNFARKGIPAPTFSLGFRAFDEEINKYYHKPGDHWQNMDLDYVMKYWKSYILAASKIADMKERPFWNKNDKYEAAGKSLYDLK